MNNRNTIQRQMVLEAVRELGNHANAEEIYQCVKMRHPSIGKGTVYRNLNILAENGLVLKIEIPNGSDCFDHNCENHYHGMCVQCNRVFDVFLKEEIDLRKEIQSTQGIEILNYDVLFKGICSSCKEGEKENDN